MRGIGAGAALRATVRLARRDAWRNRGRSALIALMVALPVLALGAVSVIYRSDQRDPQDWVTLRLGHNPSAQALIMDQYQNEQGLKQNVTGTDYLDGAGNLGAEPVSFERLSAAVAARLPSGDHLLLDRTAYPNRSLRFGDRILPARVREFDYLAPGARGLFRQVSGRAPAAAGEVEVTEAMAKAEGLRIGDRLGYGAVGAPSSQLTIVGVVGGIPLIGIEQVISRPGLVLPAGHAADQLSDQTSWLVVGPAALNWDQVLALNQVGFTATSRAVVADPPPSSRVPYKQLTDRHFSRDKGDEASLIGVLTVAIGLILLQIALLAGPAIAVGARRNERTLALVAASGGGRRQLRSIVLATSGVIGLVGCIVAAALGVGLGVLAVPLLRDHDNRQLIRTDVHPLDLLVLVAVGALTAIAAAMIPARQAARMNVVAVLTGRRGQASPPRRVPVIGVLVTLVGSVVCFYGATGHHAFITVLGIAIAEIGLVTVTGTIIALCARGAHRLPFAGRFALRDAARQRGRTAPAVAAVMAAIAGSIAVGIFVTSQDHDSQRHYQQTAAVGVATVNFDAPASPAVQTAAVAALQRTLPVKETVAYQAVATSDADLELIGPAGNNSWDGSSDLAVAGLYDTHRGGAFFDDGSALQVITGHSDPAARAALAAGKVVLSTPTYLWGGGVIHVRVVSNDDTKRTVVLPAVVIASRPGLAQPVFPLSAAAQLKEPIATSGLVVNTTRMPTKREAERAEAAVLNVASAQVDVERGYQHQYAIGLLALMLAAAAITLGGTFSAVGLAAAEGRADVSTLAAIGAGPAVRRRLAAAQAAVITVLGSGLGLLTGLLAGWALVRLEAPTGRRVYASVLSEIFQPPDGWPFVVPWPAVGALVLGVPLLAIAIGYLTTRSRLPLVRRLGQ